MARGRGHPPEGNGQKLDTFLGNVLRLDVDHGTPHGIPKYNPFVKSKHGFPEIFAYGFRNPWGISFDRGGKHDLIVANVGQDRWEEINVVVFKVINKLNSWPGAIRLLDKTGAPLKDAT